MAAASYIPTEDEILAFRRDLTSYARAAEAEGDTFTAADLRTLARIHWPGKNVRVNSDDLGIDWVESGPEPSPSAPPAEPAQVVPEAEPEPKPLVPFSDLPAHVGDRYRHKLAQIEQSPYGPFEPQKPTPGSGRGGTTWDIHGNVLRGPGVHLTDEQALTEVTNLPKYGEPGFEKSKAKARQLLAGAAKPTLSPDKQARLAQAEAEIQVEARAKFMAELAAKEARGEPVTGWRELGALAEQFGYTVPPNGRSWQ